MTICTPPHLTQCSRHSRAVRRDERGLTLLELMVTMAIAAGLIGIAASTFSQVSNTQLRVETNRLATTLRHCFGYAVSHSRYLRLVIDLDGERYWVESSERPIFLSVKKREEGQDPNQETEEEIEAREEAKEEGRPVQERARFTADRIIPERKLERGLTIRSVFTPEQDDTFTQGKAFIHFFPNGFAEPALITVGYGEGEDEGGAYTLILSPLTGKVKREFGEIEPGRYFGEPDKVEEEGR